MVAAMHLCVLRGPASASGPKQLIGYPAWKCLANRGVAVVTNRLVLLLVTVWLNFYNSAPAEILPQCSTPGKKWYSTLEWSTNMNKVFKSKVNTLLLQIEFHSLRLQIVRSTSAS